MVEDWIGKILIDKRFERCTEIILTPQVEELEDLTNVTIFLPSAEAFAQLPEPFTEMLAAEPANLLEFMLRQAESIMHHEDDNENDDVDEDDPQARGKSYDPNSQSYQWVASWLWGVIMSKSIIYASNPYLQCILIIGS